MRLRDVLSAACTRLRIVSCFVCTGFLFISSAATATEPAMRLIPRVKGYLDSPYGYWEYLPEGYHSSGEYPVVIYLHGIKEIGNGQSVSELERVARNGVPLIIRKFQRNFPFILIAPQSPAVREGFSTTNIQQLLDIVEQNYGVDKHRIYVTGVSYGAYAAWRLASAIPERLAAVVPFSSCGGDYQVANLKEVPIWAFGNVGDKQEVPACLQNLIDRIRDQGGTPLLTLYEKKGHNAWERTYKHDYMWQWLLKQRRSPRDENQSPILLNPGNRITGVGALGTFTLMASDRNNDSLMFSIEGPLAKGSHFEVMGNGLARLSLNTLTPGVFPVSVHVSDGKGGIARQHFYLQTSYWLLFLPYMLLLTFQPFIISLPHTALVLLLLFINEITRRFFGLLSHLFHWLFISILFSLAI